MTVGLLCVSNLVMLYAWYGHLRSLSGAPAWVAILVSWLIAFVEYCVAVPANRIGAKTMTLEQLKITQEAVTLLVFMPFSVLVMRQPVSWNYLAAAVCIFADKEEIGSEGVSGMLSQAFDKFMADLCEAQGVALRDCLANSFCLSADVTAAYDPSWASAFEKQNGTYAGRGVAFFKYTGSRGKSSASDANAELVGDITRLLDANNVAWQIGELGRLDLGGGGTIAFMMADWGAEVVDCGTAMLSMHAPYDLLSKADAYETYLAYKAFFESK